MSINRSGTSRESRREKKEAFEDKSRRSEKEAVDLRKTVENKANGVRIFEKIKDGLLEETLQMLEIDEQGFGRLSNKLGDAHRVKMEDYDREFNALKRDLADQLSRIDNGQRELENVVKDFRQELTDYINGTLDKIKQEKRETAHVRDDLVDRQEQLRRWRLELMQRMEEVNPENIGRLLAKQRGING